MNGVNIYENFYFNHNRDVAVKIENLNLVSIMEIDMKCGIFRYLTL